MEIRQVVGAAGQTLLKLIQRQVEVATEVLLDAQTVRQESGDVHVRAAAELGHGWASESGQPTQPAECNSQAPRSSPGEPFGFVVIAPQELPRPAASSGGIDKPAGRLLPYLPGEKPSPPASAACAAATGLKLGVGHGGTRAAVTGVHPIALGPELNSSLEEVLHRARLNSVGRRSPAVRSGGAAGAAGLATPGQRRAQSLDLPPRARLNRAPAPSMWMANAALGQEHRGARFRRIYRHGLDRHRLWGIGMRPWGRLSICSAAPTSIAASGGPPWGSMRISPGVPCASGPSPAGARRCAARSPLAAAGPGGPAPA